MAPAGELVDLVDEHDSVTGSGDIHEAVSRGLLHRAVAVLVIRGSGKYLLQQRSKNDRWHPGLWTLSSTGHVRRGESYGAAAARELMEELGLTARMSRQKKRLLPPIRSNGLTEHEWVTLFVARTDAPCKVDPVEVEGVTEVDGSQLRRMADGGLLTPDAVILLDDYLMGETEG